MQAAEEQLGNAAGADVTHPIGFNPASPFVAAMVGSMDCSLSRFAAEIMLQGNQVEVITV
jgi:hypothetical protein